MEINIHLARELICCVRIFLVFFFEVKISMESNKKINLKCSILFFH